MIREILCSIGAKRNWRDGFIDSVCEEMAWIIPSRSNKAMIVDCLVRRIADHEAQQ